MTKFFRKSLLISLVFFSISSLADPLSPVPDIDNNKQNFLGPIAKMQYASPLTDNTAGALGIEAGPRNYRGSATWGWDFADQQRIKFTGEYLRQDIDYAFSTGVSREWVQQGALGLAYEYDLNQDYLSYFDLSAYYSHAPSIDLEPIFSNYVDNANNTVKYTTLRRRIAGSNAYGISPALTINPWLGAETTFALNYDDVKYDNIYSAQTVSRGFGGTVVFNQALAYNLAINLSAGIRAPFDTYQAGINYTDAESSGDLSVGLFGRYTKGKDYLPDTSLVGLELNYSVQKNSGKNSNARRACYPKKHSLSDWVQKPAVYMPQVLAISEESLVSSICIPPVFNGSIGDYSSVDGSVNYPVGSYFSGSQLIFTIDGGQNQDSNVAINSSTGVINGIVAPLESLNVTVFVHNACGSAQSGEFIIFHD